MYCQRTIVKRDVYDCEYLSHIMFHKDTACKGGNFATIGFKPAFRFPSSLEEIQSWFDRIGIGGAKVSLLESTLPSFSNAVIAGRCSAGERYASHIEIKDASHIRVVLDLLFRREALSAGDRAYIESSLRKCEKTFEFACATSADITIAQRDLISNFIEPYIEPIKSEVSDPDVLMAYIACLGNALRIRGDRDLDIQLAKGLLQTSLTEGHTCSDSFYESLLCVVRVYVGVADLETALLQCGASLPDHTTIQGIVRETVSM